MSLYTAFSSQNGEKRRGSICKIRAFDCSSDTELTLQVAGVLVLIAQLLLHII